MQIPNYSYIRPSYIQTGYTLYSTKIISNSIFHSQLLPVSLPNFIKYHSMNLLPVEKRMHTIMTLNSVIFHPSGLRSRPEVTICLCSCRKPIFFQKLCRLRFCIPASLNLFFCTGARCKRSACCAYCAYIFLIGKSHCTVTFIHPIINMMQGQSRLLP